MANKTVTVTITPTTSGSKRTISISVDPEPVQLDNTVALDEGIEWVIDDTSTNWTFTADNQGNSTGIVIKKHRGRFRDPGAHANRKRHNWVRQQTDGASTIYEYTLSVTNEIMEPDPTKWATLTWDPLIHNN